MAIINMAMVQGNKVSWLLLPLDSLLSAVNKDDGNNKYGGGSGKS